METAPQIRVSVFKQIHEILFHGKGGYDYASVYNMPLWLRKFTFIQIKEFYDQEQKVMKDAKDGKKTSLVDSEGKVNVPEFKKIEKNYKGKSSYK